MNDTTLAHIATSLERIATALERIAAPTKRVEAPKTPEKIPEPEKVEAPEQTEPKAEAPAAEPQASPSITLDQIRKEVVAVCAMGEDKKSAVREIVTAYGRNVSAIPADKYPEVMDKLTALKEG